MIKISIPHPVATYAIGQGIDFETLYKLEFDIDLFKQEDQDGPRSLT